MLGSAAVVCAKMVRMVAATISPEPFSITAKTSRTKWTRQQCQAAPRKTVRIAATSLLWMSETTSWTFSRPRARSERRNFVQNSFDSLSPTITPRISRCPVAEIPVAMTTACEAIRWLTRALQ